MSPRTGRPTDNPKKHETRIRMSDERKEGRDVTKNRQANR